MSAATTELHEQDAVVRIETPNFNHLAHVYRWMEWLSFGPFLWQCRCFFLSRLRRHRRALVMGDGDGRFAARLLRENCDIRIDAVDGSVAMLRELARRASVHGSRLHAHAADAREFVPPRRDYDLVVTHFFLDCLTGDEIGCVARRLRKHACADAMWIVSEFAVPAGWYGRFVVRPVIALLYCAFGLLTGLKVRRLPDHHSGLRAAGWQLAEKRTWLGGMLVSELWHAG
jgi:hypothetical protein